MAVAGEGHGPVRPTLCISCASVASVDDDEIREVGALKADA